MCIGVHVCVHFLAGFARTSCQVKSYIHAGNHSYINRLRSIHALRDSVRGLMCVFLPHDDYYCKACLLNANQPGSFQSRDEKQKSS